MGVERIPVSTGRTMDAPVGNGRDDGGQGGGRKGADGGRRGRGDKEREVMMLIKVIRDQLVEDDYCRHHSCRSDDSRYYRLSPTVAAP